MRRMSASIHSPDKRSLLSERCDGMDIVAVCSEDALQCKSGRITRYDSAKNATFVYELSTFVYEFSNSPFRR